jgi:cobalt/nickel transport protein
MAKTVAMLALGIGAVAASPAPAHFQTIYTPEANLSEAATVPVDLIFWHPMSSGAVMDMGKPQEFFMVHRGERTDLLGALKPITFTSWNNAGGAFQADVRMQSPGDYVMALVPAPYYEGSEDIYIQQITKAYVNRGQLPTDWDQPVGLKAEIVPLGKPYNVVAGSTFSGVVMSDGKPVPNAEIEVEYVAALPDMTANKTGQPTVSEMPGGAIVIYSDANGQFSFGLPRAGVWGFAALGVGPDTEYNGKELSQDAVIWVNATDLGGAPTVVAAATPTAGGTVAAVAGAGAGLSADVRDQLSASIRDELRPIRTDLAVYRAESSYPVILGGIGFIVGLAGLGFYVMAYQRGRKVGV